MCALVMKVPERLDVMSPFTQGLGSQLVEARAQQWNELMLPERETSRAAPWTDVKTVVVVKQVRVPCIP